MANLHSVLAWISVAGALVLLATAAGAATGRLSSRMVLDRAILVQMATVAVALLTGLVLPFAGSGPGDPLHLLYAIVALAAAPLARFYPRYRSMVVLGRWVAVAGVVILGATLRLFMTGR